MNRAGRAAQAARAGRETAGDTSVSLANSGRQVEDGARVVGGKVPAELNPHGTPQGQPRFEPDGGWTRTGVGNVGGLAAAAARMAHVR